MQKPKVWIIQNDFNKLEQALNDIDKNSTNNYLYTNCISKFMFDEVDMFSKNFDAFLYCGSVCRDWFFSNHVYGSANFNKYVVYREKRFCHGGCYGIFRCSRYDW